MPTLFTRIINREIPADFVFEDDSLVVIRDIHPQAKTHLLIIPKKEIATVNDIQSEDTHLIAHMFSTAQKITRDLHISEGYQLHFNVGALGGQEVFHLHMHLLSDI